MLRNQNDKYDTTYEGELINTATGEVIPNDEPVFILRAKDENTLTLLHQYVLMVKGKENKAKMRATIKKFEEFEHNNPNAMKQPTL